MAAWREEVATAVEEELKTLQQDAGRWRGLGKIRPGKSAGSYLVDVRGGRTTVDSLGTLCLAGSSGPDRGMSVPVDSVRLADGVLSLTISGPVPPECDRVWAMTVSLRHLAESLRDGIRREQPAPLADALAAGRLDPVPAAVRGEPPGFLDGQLAAYRCCRRPGLRVVWGPPGTGKTKVLARAIEDLVKDDKRVLLLSTANVAVDNALAAVVRTMRPRAGQMVRVGTPQLAAIAQDDNVQLQKLAARGSAELDAERLRLQEQIAELDGAAQQIADLNRELEDFDPGRLALAERRLGNRVRASQLRSQLMAAVEAQEKQSRRAAIARTSRADAERDWRGSAEQRRHLERAAQLTEELARWDHELSALRAQVSGRRAELELAPKGIRGALSHRHRHKELKQWELELSNRERATADRHAQLRPLIHESARLASPLTPEKVRAQQEALEAARALVVAAQADADVAAERVLDLRAALDGVLEVGVAGSADEEYVERSRKLSLPALFKKRAALMAAAGESSARRTRLERRLITVNEQIRRLRTDAEQTIVERARVVAATLATARVHRALHSAQFDVVLIDEVGAARLAEVLVAVSRATETAVLFGDFLQLGPITGQDVARTPEVERWLEPNPFTHCGINSPADALRSPGCVALTHQFRFGAGLRELANDVIYEVLEDGASLTDGPARSETEVVLIDVSGLPQLAAVHKPGGRGGWWTIGALLSKALAEYHLPTSDGVGIITPYRDQMEATLAALKDSDSSLGADIGTVHAFQGREFDVVIFDLVEDGQRWVSQADRAGAHQFHRDGVRLFGVGITRARHRLYILAKLSAVQGARAGSPLGALNKMLRTGRGHVVRAETLLGLEGNRVEADPALADLDITTQLREYVQVTDLTDEMTFQDVLLEQVRNARRSLWIWSPWIGRRSEKALPLIAEAVARGVDVRVFLRTDDDQGLKKPGAQQMLAALRQTGARIIRADVEHKKIVVIDEQVVLMGSYNPLSQNRSREVMATMRGRAFAERVLQSFAAEPHSAPPRCATCDQDFELRRSQDRKKGAPYWWRCPQCKKRQDVRKA